MMSSAGKTDFLKLNKWSSTDIPKRVDFNSDNELIDAALKDHFENDDRHVLDPERAAWNMPFYAGFYYGNGALERTIVTNCPFEPVFGIIFAGGMPPSVVDFTNKVKYNYVGFLSKRSSTSGLTLNKSDFTISTNGFAVVHGDYINLNNTGLTYCYVLFR